MIGNLQAQQSSIPQTTENEHQQEATCLTSTMATETIQPVTDDTMGTTHSIDEQSRKPFRNPEDDAVRFYNTYAYAHSTALNIQTLYRKLTAIHIWSPLDYFPTLHCIASSVKPVDGECALKRFILTSNLRTL